MELKKEKEVLGISDDVECIIVEDAVGSLERFDFGGRFLWKVGKGRMKSPGHPGGNQMFYNQIPFIKTSARQRLFPVFRKLTGGKYVYYGKYEYSLFRKRESFEGFTYFVFKMLRREVPDA